MCRAAPLLLLILLLAVDWAWDPHYGASPFSSPYSSQPCLHLRAGRQHLPARLDRGPFGLAAVGSDALLLASPLEGPRPTTQVAGGSGTVIVYLFMSIRC